MAGEQCPLTPLENWLRTRGGSEGYSGDFIVDYLEPILYPAGLTRDVQILLGVLAFVWNSVLYGLAFRRR